jgi:hypothetical protein
MKNTRALKSSENMNERPEMVLINKKKTEKYKMNR